MIRKYKLDQEEQDLLEALEQNELKTDAKSSRNKKVLVASAKAYGNKTKRVNVRLSERDYLLAQETALREGMPYATLIGSIVHKFLTGQLVEKYRLR